MGCWELAEKSVLISLFDADCETKASCGGPVHFQRHLLFTSGIESSAKRKSLITVSFNFVTVCRRLRLKSLPSDLCLMLILATQSSYASVSIAENIELDSVGARRQPC